MWNRLCRMTGIVSVSLFLVMPVPFNEMNIIRPESVVIPAYISPEPLIDPKIVALDAFFQKHKCPYRDSTEYLKAAEDNNLDYRLLPAISVLEEGCGIHNPDNNLFGYYGNGKYGLHPFNTIAEGVEYVARQLNQNPLYVGKTLKQKLKVYNSVNPKYYNEIIGLMGQVIQ